jgi:hypothetical protein
MPTEPNVKSFTAKDTDGRDVRFTVATDIVDYIHAARTFGGEDLGDVASHGRYQGRVLAIPDRAGEVVAPMLLTIGSANRLRLVRRDRSGLGGGWKTVDLNAGLAAIAGTDPKLRAIGAAWSNEGLITVAVAVEDRAAGGPSRLLIAYNLSSEPASWEEIAWVDYGTRGNTVIHGIRVVEDEGGLWTTVLDSDHGTKDTFLLIRSDGQRTLDRALVFSTAVEYQEIHDFEPMVEPFVGPGIAVLGGSGSRTVLSFRPFPKFDNNGRAISVPPAVPLPCPEGARLLAVGQNRNGGHDLYIGGDGVHLIPADEFDNQDDAKIVRVIAREAATGVRRLAIAEQPDGAVSVWALRTNGDLVTARTGSADRTADAFSTPLRLRAGVQELAPVHGDHCATTSMVAVYTDGRAAHIHRDAETGAWLEAPVLVAAPDQAAKMSCYGVALRFLDNAALPRAGQKVTVSASALTTVILNGRSVFIGPQVSVEAETDHNGAINLYDRVRSLTPPVYRFAIDGYGKVIDVNPSAGVQERFATMTAAELRKATVPDGKGGETPLLPAEFRTGGRSKEVDGMVAALNRTAGMALDATAGVLPGVRECSGGAFSARLGGEDRQAALRKRSPASRWAITAGTNGIGMADAATIDRVVAAAARPGGGAFADLGDSIADFF